MSEDIYAGKGMTLSDGRKAVCIRQDVLDGIVTLQVLVIDPETGAVARKQYVTVDQVAEVEQ